MRLFSRFKYLYLAHFSKPVCDRAIYRAIWRRGVRKILEIGIGTAGRSVRMIDLAARATTGDPIRYVAIDLFEARPADGGPGLPLKEAHRVLKATVAAVQLVPGDPASALARSANALQKIDLVVISAGHDEQSLARAWFYLPRMLHEGSVVLLESAPSADGQRAFNVLTPAEVAARTEAARRRAA